MSLRKLTRTQLRGFALAHLRGVQGGLCPLCERAIDVSIPREMVVDHDHYTGEIRGVLHRGCNGAEGKVANAVGRWAGLGMDYAKIVPWLERLVQYLKQPGTGMIYPEHKTAEEKAEAARVKKNKAQAARRATAKVRVMLPRKSE